MTIVKSTTFASLLRKSRRTAGLTQEELAAQAGLSVNAISALERGVNQAPRKDTVSLLADALGLSEPERAAFEAAARGRLARPAPTTTGPTGGAAASTITMPAVGTLPLVGRARELALLRRHLTASSGTYPALLLLAGEPGIGKSRLLLDAATQARNEGWTVLVGRCHRRGGQEPYEPLLGALGSFIRHTPAAPLRDALDGCSWLVRLLPELAESGLVAPPRSSLTPDQERRLMFAAVERFLENLAGPSGTLLVLDDLQWAGADALDLLAALLRSPGETPVRVVGAYRDTEVRAQDPLGVLLADLAREGLATQHDLGRLNTTDAQELLQTLLGSEQAGEADQTGVDVPSDRTTSDPGRPHGVALSDEAKLVRVVAHVLRRAAGVPFFVVSYAQAIRLDGVDTLIAEATDQGEGRGTGDSSPSGLRRVAGVPWEVAQGIRQRVAALPEEARDLLGVAAVAGREVARSVLFASAGSGRDEDTLLAALEAACHGGLLEEAGDEGYVFAHDLIREVVLSELSAGRRALLHRKVAEALERLSGELAVDQLAFHFAHGGDAEKTITYLKRAGDKAVAAQAHAVAQGYYRELVERLDAAGRTAEAASAREQLGLALRNLGRHDEALARFEEAIAICQGTGDLERLAWVVGQVGWLHMTRGAPQEALGRIVAALPTFEEAGHTHGLAVLYTTLADLHYTAGQYAEQLAAAERAAELARAAGDQHFLAQAEQLRARALILLGPPDEGLRAMQEAIRLAEGRADLANLCVGLCMTSLVDWVQGRFAHEREAAGRALEVAARLGEPMLAAFSHAAMALCLLSVGDWQEARDELALGQAEVERGEATMAMPYVAAVQGALELATGASEAGERHLRQAVRAVEQSGDLLPLRYAQSVLAEHELLVDRPEEARAGLLPLLDRPGQQETYVVPLLPLVAWAELELGATEQAETHLAEALTRARTRDLRLALVDAQRVYALLLLRRGEWDAAARAVAEALDVARAITYPHAEIKALYTFGLLDAARGEVDQARAHFEAGLAICRRLGERQYAARIEHALAKFDATDAGR